MCYKNPAKLPHTDTESIMKHVSEIVIEVVTDILSNIKHLVLSILPWTDIRKFMLKMYLICFLELKLLLSCVTEFVKMVIVIQIPWCLYFILAFSVCMTLHSSGKRILSTFLYMFHSQLFSICLIMVWLFT